MNKALILYYLHFISSQECFDYSLFSVPSAIIQSMIADGLDDITGPLILSIDAHIAAFNMCLSFGKLNITTVEKNHRSNSFPSVYADSISFLQVLFI